MALTLTGTGQGGVFTLRGRSFGGSFTTSTAPPSLLLDTYPGAAAAYSLRKLRTAYTGAAIRVKRLNDGIESDIGFNTNGQLDSTSLTTFVGVNSAIVVRWYDQSGNSNNASVTDPNALSGNPRIVNLGVINLQNGKPSIEFFVNPMNFITNLPSINSSCFLIGKANSNSISGPLFGTTDPGVFIGQQIGNYAIYKGSTTNLSFHRTAANSSTTNFKINSFFTDTNNIFVNNTLIPITENGTFTGSSFTIQNIGNYAAFYSTQGFISEAIIYSSNISSNLTAINANINSYYSIY